MPYDRFKHHRRSIRLREYDYAQPGAYFVTMVTNDRECSFGEVLDARARLNEYGEIVRQEWVRTAEIRSEIVLDVLIVMPNHVHGILFIRPPEEPTVSNRPVGPHGRAPLHRPPRTIGSFVAGFKSIVTKRINVLRGTPAWPVWQRNYHEHIIRDDDELRAKREYIALNPARWDVDSENPRNVQP